MRVAEPFSLALEPYEFSNDFGMQSSFSNEGQTANFFFESEINAKDEWDTRTPSPSRVCTICAAPSNGYHFNAASCSACAAFFRRTVTLNRNFVCSQQGNCRVNYAMRVICRACRYAKCLTMGMERSAVQPRRDCNVGRRKISYAARAAPATHVEPTQPSPEQNHYAASYSSSVSGDAPSPNVGWSPPVQSAETVLEDLMKEERLQNERRKLLYCSRSSVSHLLSSAPINDIPFGPSDLCELTFAGIQKDIRPQILVLFEWMRGWQHFPLLEPRDKKSLLRRCLLYHTILDPAYLTVRLGLPDRFVMFNGMYVGIAEDSQEGWKDEDGIINSKMKQELYRPLLDRVLKEICLPMRDIGLTYVEFLILKALISFKSASVADVSPTIRELMLAHIDQLFRALHVHYRSQGASPDFIAQRTGNIVLLISSVFAVGMECFENHQKIQFFDLWQLDELLVKLIASGSM